MHVPAEEQDRTWAPTTAEARTVACVELFGARGPAGQAHEDGGGPVGAGRAGDDRARGDPDPGDDPAAVLHRLHASIRKGDQVCPVGPTRAVVVFGPGTPPVHPTMVGRRLLTVLNNGAGGRVGATGVAVTVVVADTGLDPGQLTRRLLRAADGIRTRHRASAGGGPVSRAAYLAVDTPVANGSAGAAADDTPRLPVLHRCAVTVARAGHDGLADTVPFAVGDAGDHRYDGNGHDGRAAANGYGTHGHGQDAGDPEDRAVLIVDTNPSSRRRPGLAALSAATVAERSGFRTVIEAVGDGGSSMAGHHTDLVVLVLDGGQSHAPAASWGSSPWNVAARLTDTFVFDGATVLAVSVGADSGVLSACVERGAAPLFDLDQLPGALHAVRTAGDTSFNSRSAPGPDDGGSSKPLPYLPGFYALLQLTASERKVLFYLTRGFSAQDISDDLLVSLTTVRSHIRSILRKLNVRSQLGAVAVANSTFVPDEARRELT